MPKVSLRGIADAEVTFTHGDGMTQLDPVRIARQVITPRAPSRHVRIARPRSRRPAPRRVSGSRRVGVPVTTTASAEPTGAPPPEDAPSRRGTLAPRSAS